MKYLEIKCIKTLVLVLYMPSAIRNVPLIPLKRQGAEEGGTKKLLYLEPASWGCVWVVVVEGS